MENHTSEVSVRLEKLERGNRQMKKIGIVAAILVSMFIVGGQAKTNRVIDANEFVLKDGNGKVRARLAINDTPPLQMDTPGLLFYDAEGHSRISITASENQSRIYLGSSQQTASSAMWAGLPGTDGSGVGITGPAGVFRVNLDGFVGGPQLSLEDKEGYSIHIGKTDLMFTKSGKKEQTPAASVVLFDKDQKVLWSAP